MMRRRLALGALVACFVALGLLLCGAGKTVAPLTARQQEGVIGDVAEMLQGRYVCPETAAVMSAAIARHLEEGAYARLTSPQDFAKAVFRDMYALSRDKQLGFSYNPDRAADILRTQNRDRRCSVLCSGQSSAGSCGFSGADEFCYTMNVLRARTPADERTPEGEHPVQFIVVQSAYVLRIPYSPASDDTAKDDRKAKASFTGRG
jgi:hypothetical protein